MTHINPTEYYNSVEADASAQLAQLSRRVAVVSWMRLVVAVAAIASAWWLWGNLQAVTVAIVACIVLFLALVKLHNRLFAAVAMQKAMKQAAADNLKRIKLDLSQLDGGDEYIDSHHSYSYDLDLFGKKSVFSLLNATATQGGKDMLARNLCDTSRVTADIELRQEAVKELAEMHDFRLRLQALGVVAQGEEDGKGRIAGSDNIAKFTLRWWQRVAIYLFPTAMALLVVLAIVGIDVSVYIETCFVASLMVAVAGSKRVGMVHTEVEKIVNRISVYHNLLSEIEQHSFRSQLLVQLQRQLGEGDERSSAVSHKLARLLSNLDQRHNWLSYILLNALLQWDYRQWHNVMRWMGKYADKLQQWNDVLDSIDELCALATFAFNNPTYSFPAIGRSGDTVIEARKLGHPLIAHERCVCNDVTSMTTGNFMVVTGANMAGKSTYLRTVGVNYLLAMVGAPVFAAEMTVGVASLFTGLRTTDSLNDNESYFFAELRRLQTIIRRAEAGERLFVILDEILKGTNSTDKQKGSLALVDKLVGMNVAGIIATHDLVLGSLANRFPGRVFNRCFEAEIDGETLRFDYTLHPGIAKNLNAYFLMQHMGIV